AKECSAQAMQTLIDAKVQKLCREILGKDKTAIAPNLLMAALDFSNADFKSSYSHLKEAIRAQGLIDRMRKIKPMENSAKYLAIVLFLELQAKDTIIADPGQATLERQINHQLKELLQTCDLVEYPAILTFVKTIVGENSKEEPQLVV